MKEEKLKNNDIKNILKDYLYYKEEKKFFPINRNLKNENYKDSENISKLNKNKTFEKTSNGKNNNNVNELFSRKKENYSKVLSKSNTNFNSPKSFGQNNINSLKKDLIKKNYKLAIHQPFVTTIDFKNIQTNEEESKMISPIFKSQKNNLTNFGKSLNQILINNINEAIMKKGSLIKKKKRNTFSANIYYQKQNYQNFNNYEIHKKIFDDKLIQMYEDYTKKQKLYKKQKLNNLSPHLEEKRKKIYSRIPLCIKGYKKNEVDIFYTRNICDLDYQKYYMKEKINMNDILENHNIYNRKDYISGKVPFFMLTKSVVKPICKKSISHTNIFRNEFKEINF